MVLARPLPADAAFEQCYLHDLALQGKHFDLVISNHLMHHLSDEENLALFNDIETVTRGAALMNDLRRSPVSWAAYGLATLPVRWYSFLSIDGMRSIRRSYTPEELMHLTQRMWHGRRYLAGNSGLALQAGCALRTPHRLKYGYTPESNSYAGRLRFSDCRGRCSRTLCSQHTHPERVSCTRSGAPGRAFHPLPLYRHSPSISGAAPGAGLTRIFPQRRRSCNHGPSHGHARGSTVYR